MQSIDNRSELDPEFDAMKVVYLALKELDIAAQQRVLDYVFKRLSLTPMDFGAERTGSSFSPQELVKEALHENQQTNAVESQEEHHDEMDGISPLARKWMRRNSLTAEQLSNLYTLGVDEIDLVAKKIAGKNKKEKMRSVILLSGVASYLSSGVPRVAHEAVKATLTDYDAYDVSNFAAYMKDLASEVSGSKDNGYTLTARGLAAAAELLQEMAAKK